MDIRENTVAELRRQFAEVKSVVGDCQRRMCFKNDHFDRILAIHVLEHLPNIPSAVREMHRLRDKKKGILSVFIPCERSMAHSLTRKISARGICEKRYKQSYCWFVERDQINLPHDIFEELSLYFSLEASTYYPIPIPLEFYILCTGASFNPKRKAA